MDRSAQEISPDEGQSNTAIRYGMQVRVVVKANCCKLPYSVYLLTSLAASKKGTFSNGAFSPVN